jgi:hypothetical protein
MPKAAATCIKPESLLTKALALAMTARAVSNEVRPDKSRHWPGLPALARRAISAHRVLSLAEPSNTQGHGSKRAKAEKCLAGQRLAGPNSAPGAST